ncbi:hypothetical protein [Saccharothrix xinjiangensis]|uniref:Uncharacterized protein n=1 Tax=Saccharothrix xinjiangensis TaxID=204798 RepID=A0ABV9XP24_9PSEU
MTGVDFGFRGGVVTGSAWIDENADGLRRPSEPPLANTPFMACGGGFAGTGHTDDEGEYRATGGTLDRPGWRWWCGSDRRARSWPAARSARVPSR